MKADFESIGKRLPYSEPDGYVDRLIERCTDRAISQRRAARGSHIRLFTRRVGIITASMAAAILIAIIAFPAMLGYKGNRYSADAIAHSMTLDQVLSSMSNDELAAIDYYSFDDMPTIYDEDYEE